MKCKNCPAVWGGGGHMTSCGMEYDDYGCHIFGRDVGAEDESCYLTESEVRNRLYDLRRYYDGEIVRPKWVENRFIHDMDGQVGFECGFPSFPPKRCRKQTRNRGDGEEYYFMDGVSIHGNTDRYYGLCNAYRKGYEDAKAGKEFNDWYPKEKPKEGEE